MPPRQSGCWPAGLGPLFDAAPPVVDTAVGEAARASVDPAGEMEREDMPMITVAGTELSVTDTGGTGPTVVFLHGFLFDGRQFDAQVDALRGQYRCITVDLPGQGRSGRSAAGYSTDAVTDLLIAYLEQADLGPVHLAGLSMGGFTGLRIAIRRPELLRSLTLINTSAHRHSRAKMPKQLALAAVARVAGTGLPPVLAGIEEEMFGERFRTDDSAAPVREAWRRRWADGDRAVLVSTLLGFLRRDDVRADLAGIALPTLIVAGAQDRSLPAHLSIAMFDAIPDARLVVLPGTGHSAPVEDPEGVSQAMASFLAEASDSNA